MRLLVSLPYSWLRQLIAERWADMTQAAGEGIVISPLSQVEIEGRGNQLVVSQRLKIGITPDWIGFRRAIGLTFALPKILTFSIEITLLADGAISEEWELSLHTSGSFSWIEKPSTLGIFPLPLTEFLAPTLERELENLCQYLNMELPRIVGLPAIIREVEAELASSIALDATWALEMQTTIRAEGPIVAKASHLETYVGVTPSIAVYVSSEGKEQAKQAVATFKAAKGAPVSVHIPWQEIQSWLTGAIVPVTLGPFSRDLKLEKIDLTEKEGYLETVGIMQIWDGQSGKSPISFKAILELHFPSSHSPTLLIHSLIVRDAPWWSQLLVRFGKKRLTGWISKALTLQLRTEIEQLFLDTKQQLKDIPISKEHQLHVTPHSPHFQKVIVAKSGLIWNLQTKGEGKLSLFSKVQS